MYLLKSGRTVKLEAHSQRPRNPHRLVDSKCSVDASPDPHLEWDLHSGFSHGSKSCLRTSLQPQPLVLPHLWPVLQYPDAPMDKQTKPITSPLTQLLLRGLSPSGSQILRQLQSLFLSLYILKVITLCNNIKISLNIVNKAREGS